jgi:hypothetical protein
MRYNDHLVFDDENTAREAAQLLADEKREPACVVNLGYSGWMAVKTVAEQRRAIDTATDPEQAAKCNLIFARCEPQ